MIQTIDPARAQGDLAEIYRDIANARGGIAALMRAQSLNPAALQAHFELYSILLFGRSELERRTREMIGVVVSAANQCDYGVEHHSEPLRGFGVEQELLEALAEGEIPNTLSAALRGLLSYARTLTLTPTSNEAQIEALRELGWSDAAILDATMVCSYFNFINRITVGLGVTLERGFEETCAPELVTGE
ncbi:MAG: putative peroxidase-related enzyme [Bradymonadia bacterium]|jgi:uncharacterized peroxidase-related enzyme